jgi:hypothetical protein
VLTGAQSTVERRHDDGEERWRLELSARAEEGKRELKSEGKRCGVLQGWSSPFIMAGGALGRQQLSVTGSIKALTPLMSGRGYEGVKPGDHGG